MGKIEVNRITNAGVYIDGNSFIGKVEEISLPNIKPTMSEHKALGLQAKLELPSGIDKMDGKIKFNSNYPNVKKKFANFYAPLELQVRYLVESYASGGRTTTTGQIFLTIQSKGVSGGNFKQHDNVENESDFNVLYMKEVMDGVTTYEVDVINNIYIVDGVDLLKEFKDAIGG